MERLTQSEHVFRSPIGDILFAFDGEFLTSLTFAPEGTGASASAPESGPARRCFQELEEYFSGGRKVFTVKTKLDSTPFRLGVWEALRGIPYGETRSYKDVAAAVGRPEAARAVGGANHHNPVSIIIPCHRVIGANGRMVGYGGELWRKEWLLAHERKNIMLK